MRSPRIGRGRSGSIVEEACEKYPGRRNVADMPPDDGWAYEPGTVAEAVYFQTRMRRRTRLSLQPTPPA